MGQILLIVHQESSEPGLVGQVLQDSGCSLDIRRPCLGQALPKTLDEHDGVIVFGGPMSANDDDTLPFIRTELDWIAATLAAETPFLGICLGGQLLARVLGAKVAPHPEDSVEIGYLPIAPTAAGADFPNTVYQWHREGFELPHGAELLARGDRFPHQAFRYGRAYGLQFHPEITAALIDRWTTVAADHLDRPDAQPRATQLENHARYGVAVEQWLRSFLRQWLQGSTISDRPPLLQELGTP